MVVVAGGVVEGRESVVAETLYGACREPGSQFVQEITVGRKAELAVVWQSVESHILNVSCGGVVVKRIIERCLG